MPVIKTVANTLQHAKYFYPLIFILFKTLTFHLLFSLKCERCLIEIKIRITIKTPQTRFMTANITET